MPVSRRKPVTKNKRKQVCVCCGSIEGFYKSKQAYHKYFETLPICKHCIFDIYEEAYHRFQNIPKAVIDVCQKVNVPFVQTIFDVAKKEMETQNADVISSYFKFYNSSRIKKDMVFADSDMFKNTEGKLIYVDPEEGTKEEGNNAQQTSTNKTPQEVIDRFGQGYTSEEYLAMQNKYELLMDNYHAPTYMHIESLVTFVKYRTKEEFAIASSNVEEAKKWADLAKNAATAAKINPSQFSKSDLQGGVNTFSEVAKLIEQSEDIIKILPEFRMTPMDVPDFIIWCYINYARELKGLPRCSYKEVYSFYDSMLSEFIEQNGDPYGLFSEAQTSDEKRTNIKKFISDIEDFDGNILSTADDRSDDSSEEGDLDG
jgi:hypothetical protein